MPDTQAKPKRGKFKAEIQQVLDILIHSLYTDKEIFLRELISNSSDALNRIKIESLKSQEVWSPKIELGIWIEGNPENNTLTIRDTGIGMTQDDLAKNLGTIAHSGAKGFIEAMKDMNKGKDTQSTTDVIGQFGVGFYSVFMVADEVTVTSRSYDPKAQAAFWRSKGQGSFTTGEADKLERGTEIVIKLKEEAKEFAESYRLRNIVKTHSDFVAFPIYLKEEKEEDGKKTTETNQVNEQTAIWRESARDIDEEKHKKFYQQLTFDYQAPLRTIHFAADMPIQFYALLYVPSRRDYRMFNNADDYGLKLYARKVLIQDDFKDLLPPYLRFIVGVVDSEDLQLNVSRETVQATPMIQKIRKALIGRIASDLGKMATDEPEKYQTFYKDFGQHLKEGIAGDFEYRDRFIDLLRFSSSKSENENDWVSLEQYAERMKDDQKEIYYLLGQDYDVIQRSSHLEYFKKNDIEVLYFTDPMDSFMLMGLNTYKDKPLKNIDEADLDLPDDAKNEDKAEDKLADDVFDTLLAKFKDVLGDKVEDVRESKLLTDSAARLTNPAGGVSSMYRVQKLMGQEAEIPKKVLELNRNSDMLSSLSSRLSTNTDDPILPVLIEQVFENELLMEGIHPNPAEMIPRIQKLMAEASKG